VALLLCPQDPLRRRRPAQLRATTIPYLYTSPAVSCGSHIAATMIPRGAIGLARMRVAASPLAWPRFALTAPARAAAPASAARSMRNGLPFRTAVVRFQSTSASRGATSFAQHITVANIRKYWPQIAAGGGALVVLYGLSSGMIAVTQTFLNLDFKQVFYFGFGTGVVSMAMLAGVGVLVWRRVGIAPTQVARRAVARVQAHPSVRAALGPSIKPGSLRAYVVHRGHFSVEKRMAWVEPRCQMLFQVVGDKGEGMISAEAVNHAGSIHFNVIAVDTLARAGAPSAMILVAGKEDKLHVRGQLRGFLQTERAQYIPQDKTERDEDRVAEQASMPSEPEPAPEEAAGAGAGSQNKV
jgi:hypothetical protein